jgi:peroxiredoxin
MRCLIVCLVFAGAAIAGDSTVDKAVAKLEAETGKLPGQIAIELRLHAAGMLKERHPELANRLKKAAFDGLRAEGWASGGIITVAGAMSQAAGAFRVAAPARPKLDPEISRRIGSMRGLPTDADRARLVLEVTPLIRAQPAGIERLLLIRSLAGVATEGDLGSQALTAVASTLAGAIRDSYPVLLAAKYPASYAEPYVELAKLVRYERVTIDGSDPALDAALALLEIRERTQEEAGFALTALDGKQYTLASLKGRVVMLNFWATWCPPCRREMPDMEKLHRVFESKGLTILAVSDEKRDTVEGFLAKNPYTFPILLDPGGATGKAFSVDGIPKTFLFDREGRLAAQAIDMRTESQFLELLKRAGLE